MVSVLVAVYNVEDYLPRCLDSVLSQTYHDLEIILVDDGSTDSSGSICEEYVKKDERVRVIHQANEGLSSARNAGLRAATGDYILMIDGDDALHPQMIEILYNLITSGDYDFSMCYGERIYDVSETDDKSKSRVDVISPLELTAESCFWNMYEGESSSRIQYYVTWNKLFKKEILHNCYFKKLPAKDTAQDQEYNIRIYLKMRKGVYISDYLYYWIVRKDSLSNQGISIRFVSVPLTLLVSLNDIPPMYKEYRAFLLRHLYKMILSRRYWARNTEFYTLAKDNGRKVKQQTFSEFWKNPYIPTHEKYIISLFYYCPSLYGLFVKMMELLSKLKKVR